MQRHEFPPRSPRYPKHICMRVLSAPER
jgi:hypothetical protein